MGVIAVNGKICKDIFLLYKTLPLRNLVSGWRFTQRYIQDLCMSLLSREQIAEEE